MTVPLLVGFKGGDAMSVCFNTVAILFLCEVDNIVFTVGLSERVRARVEGAGRVELGHVAVEALVRTKIAHTIGIMLSIGALPFSRHVGWSLVMAPAVFWVGGVVDSFAPKDSGEDGCGVGARICMATGASLLGMVGWGVLLVVCSL
jgi:hypothetical protein